MGINTTILRQDDDGGALWPALPYHAWQDTRETLHMWTQIVGSGTGLVKRAEVASS
jgi:uncharacterized protein DUF5996